jgi:hypothetical protein
MICKLCKLCNSVNFNFANLRIIFQIIYQFVIFFSLLTDIHADSAKFDIKTSKLWLSLK